MMSVPKLDGNMELVSAQCMVRDLEAYLNSDVVYWHVAEPTVSIGQIVYRGDVIGQIADRDWNSHLHWEIRTWGDGSNLFPPTSAGGRGTCNGRVPALGYTWDDELGRTSPNAWGYVDPIKFIKEHR